MKKFFVLFSLILLPAAAEAAVFHLGLEPIVGYERVQKLVPIPHARNRLIYGARLTAGVLLISAEAEYLKGSDEEIFPEQDLTVKDTDDKLKIGLVSSVRMGRIFLLEVRGGAQAKRNTHAESQFGSTVTTISPITYKPYGGLGLRAGLGRAISLNGAVTVVFNDFPRMEQNEYQTTLGFTIQVP